MPETTGSDFYEEVGEWLPNPKFIFLNYGYSHASNGASDWIEEHDDCYRLHLSLVDHVFSGVELAGRRVLEVGSGRGGNCYFLSRYTRAIQIYGIELCEANVRFCRNVHHLPNVSFLRGDAQQLPLLGESFDVVLNLESSHCYPHFERFLAEVHRVLKPGGIFCYADLWFLQFSKLDWDSRRRALDEAPFSLLSEEDISEPVFQALKSREGLAETIRAMRNETNSRFVEEVVDRLNVVRLTLGLGQFSYRLWRFRKP
jgi:SAM-dependent methyltransferase